MRRVTGLYDLEAVSPSDGAKLTIHVDTASNQALVGTDRIFFLHLDDYELTFKSPSVVIPNGSTSIVQLSFGRAD